MRFTRVIIRYRYILLLGLVIHIISGLISSGPIHPDEHFQSLEFLGTKLYGTSVFDLPWEYDQKIRPWVQVGFLYLIAWPLKSLLSPASLEILFRVIYSLISMIGMISLISLTIEKFKNEKIRVVYIFLSQFLWIIPFMGARLLSGTLATSIFFIGLYFFKRNKQMTVVDIICSSLFLTLSFYIRYQMAFFLLPLFIHTLIFNWDQRVNTLKTLLLCSAVLLCMVGVDFWGYGELTFTPWNYFVSNILKNKASEYGMYPWWWYFWIIPSRLGPALGYISLLALFLYIGRRYKDYISWMMLLFLFIHILVPHKEFRFLFPILFILPLILTDVLDYIFSKINKRSLQMAMIGAVIALMVDNSFYLYEVCTIPANLFFDYFKFLQSDTLGDAILYTKESWIDPNRPEYMLKLNYYGNKQYPFLSLDKKTSTGSYYYFTHNVNEFFDLVKGDDCKMIYPTNLERTLSYLNQRIKKKIEINSLWRCNH